MSGSDIRVLLTSWPATSVRYLGEDAADYIAAQVRSHYPGVVLVLLGHDGWNRLLASLMQPRQSFFGQDLYPSLASKASALFCCLIRNHPFLDGNKRFGTLALLYFLDLNGYYLDVSDDMLVSWALALASANPPTIATVTSWISYTVRAQGT